MASNQTEFIDGIYHYCDRWCEQCSMTTRCRLFAAEQVTASREPETADAASPAIWQALERTLRDTCRILREMVRKRGIDLKGKQSGVAQRRPRPIRRKLREHPLVAGSQQYAEHVDSWFQSHVASFQEKGDDLIRRAWLALKTDDPEGESLRISRAIDVVRWYQIQVPAKLCRAVSTKLSQRGHACGGDADGSAKVALLGIDRSVASWLVLRTELSEEEDSILDLLAELDRLRRSTEHEFPTARSFVRPGFDPPA